MSKIDITQCIEEILKDFLTENNLELYRVLYKKEGKDWILRVFIDKPVDSDEKFVNIYECEQVNRFLSEKLDEMDFIDRSYKLEVSSPGLDRELITDSDFMRFIGRQVDVKTYEPINNQKSFTGILLSKKDEVIKVEFSNEIIELKTSQIAKINLSVIF